jgi:hypothetical protein
LTVSWDRSFAQGGSRDFLSGPESPCRPLPPSIVVGDQGGADRDTNDQTVDPQSQSLHGFDLFGVRDVG